MQRRFVGSVVGVMCAVALGAAMLPLRSHISVSTAALVFIVPVVVGAVMGGFGAGAASVVAGFLIYEFVFIPPYNTLSVGAAQDWVTLVVYVVVMLLIARVVDVLERTRSEALRGHEVIKRVSEVAELLVGDQPGEDLLHNIVKTAMGLFNVPGVSLLELEAGRLVVVASAGAPLSVEELRQLDPHSGVPVTVGMTSGSPSQLRTVVLSSADRPVGILAMRGQPIEESERAVLNTFANDAALALERAQLREQAIRSKLLEESDRFRRGLLGAVSHDLHTPLATIKVASSTLASRAGSLTAEDTHELHELIEIEADRLTRLVTNLLDMTRIEAGVLTLQREPTPLDQVVGEALDALAQALAEKQLVVVRGGPLPVANVDHALMGHVVINLIDNAIRHSPPRGQINVTTEVRGIVTVLLVSDQGPGVPDVDRGTIFDRFTQLDTGGRAGLGLTIAKTFVEAHGERIWYEEAPGGGAGFVLSLPTMSEAPR